MRTFTDITVEDLREMRGYALEELQRFLGLEDGRYEAYRERLVAICLCQGAAQHYLHKSRGVRNLDIWLFFRGAVDGERLPPLPNAPKAITAALTNLPEVRIDFMSAIIPASCHTDGTTEGTLRGFLAAEATPIASELARKPVIGLAPWTVFGQAVWAGNDKAHQAA
jgi:hypothetical protein